MRTCCFSYDSVEADEGGILRGVREKIGKK